MRVGQILKTKDTRIITIRLRETVGAAAKMMVTENIGALVVTDVVMTEGSTVVGMLSERDLMRALVASNGQDILKLPVEKLMSKKLISCSPDDDLADVMEKMDRYAIRHLPVLDDHTLVGVLSVRDVIRVLRGAVAESATVAAA
jgi:CBS domain-containing protein